MEEGILPRLGLPGSGWISRSCEEEEASLWAWGKLAASPRYKGGIQLARGGEGSTESSSVGG
ncbi:hypothetical protein [Oryza sativa Japonica Group]|uniref:Uncharacterized protein n=1 Tax=Oryza sativa subsp. japonica TaxID=39947 RepID=Q5N7H6_ORYSJ|nr:hypothetical protein [Oryza sativa Japonica Group]